jgi:hypothetical protein
MGPAVVVAAPIALGVILSRDKSEHRVVNRVTSTIKIGGQLKNVKRITQYRKNQAVEIKNLDTFLAAHSMPPNKIK